MGTVGIVILVLIVAGIAYALFRFLSRDDRSEGWQDETPLDLDEDDTIGYEDETEEVVINETEEERRRREERERYNDGLLIPVIDLNDSPAVEEPISEPVEPTHTIDTSEPSLGSEGGGDFSGGGTGGSWETSPDYPGQSVSDSTGDSGSSNAGYSSGGYDSGSSSNSDSGSSSGSDGGSSGGDGGGGGD